MKTLGKIEVIDLSTNKIYDSIHSACIEFKIKRCTLSRYLSGKSKNKTNLRYYGERYIDLTGMKFGKWVVVELDKENDKKQLRWICRCECGNIHRIIGHTLRCGGSTKCSKCKTDNSKKDIIGIKFGRWTAIEECGKNGKNTFFWLCKCECGKEKIINGCSLRSGNSRSCGCLKGPPRRKNRELIIYDILYRGLVYRNREYKADIISFQDFFELSKLNCHYCNTPPSNSRKDTITESVIYYTGLDQIIPGQGYAKNNVVPCCKFCNGIKNDMLQDEFRAHVISIYNFWDNKTSIGEYNNDAISMEEKSFCENITYKKTQRRIDRKFAILNRAYTKIKNRFCSLNNNKYPIITFEYFMQLSLGNCFYCGSPPHKKLKDRIISSGQIVYVNGIDRINSNSGYINGNVRSCCKRCNQGKMELSENDFRKVIVSIYNHWASKKNTINDSK